MTAHKQMFNTGSIKLKPGEKRLEQDIIILSNFLKGHYMGAKFIIYEFRGEVITRTDGGNYRKVDAAQHMKKTFDN